MNEMSIDSGILNRHGFLELQIRSQARFDTTTFDHRALSTNTRLASAHWVYQSSITIFLVILSQIFS